MDTRGSYTIHRIFICALFILGQAVIFLPKGISLADLLISCVIGLLLAMVFNFILTKFHFKKQQKVAAIIVLPFLIFFFLTCCRDYVVFTDSTKMPNTSAAVIAVFFAVLSILGGRLHRESLLRLSIVIFIVAILILFLLVLFSLPLIKQYNLHFGVNYKSILSLLISTFLPSLAVVSFIKGKHNPHSTVFFGMLSGIGLLLLCAFLCSLVLGSVTSLVSYPLATVGGNISIGKGFLRFEGFVYILTMLTSFIKSAVLVFLIKKASLILSRKFYKAMLFILPILAAIISAFAV